MLKSCLLQWCIVILVTNKVLSNTKPSNVCMEDADIVDMTIETGDVRFAGTDCDYSLLLRSDNGGICQHHGLDNNGNDRERKSIDKYRICCPRNFINIKEGLSMLAFIQLGVAGKYPGPCTDDWLLERIELRINGRDLLDYTFKSWTFNKRKVLFGLSKINGTNYIRI